MSGSPATRTIFVLFSILKDLQTGMIRYSKNPTTPHLEVLSDSITFIVFYLTMIKKGMFLEFFIESGTADA
jgi:hypothetical protein